MNLEAFEALALSRRSCRHFSEEKLPEGVLERLLNCARWAPSGYNLQPVHFVTVSDRRQKEQLYPACMKQAQILEAPVVVIFAGDLRPMESNFEETVRLDSEAGAMTPAYEQALRKFVPLAFSGAPLGLGRIAKKLAAPLVRCFAPMPDIPVANPRFWTAKQVMLSAMNFMLAAHAAGLGTVPMEGFDESRVKKVVGLPGRFMVPVIVPVGFAANAAAHSHAKKSRLPLPRMWHDENYSG